MCVVCGHNLKRTPDSVRSIHFCRIFLISALEINKYEKKIINKYDKEIDEADLLEITCKSSGFWVNKLTSKKFTGKPNLSRILESFFWNVDSSFERSPKFKMELQNCYPLHSGNLQRLCKGKQRNQKLRFFFKRGQKTLMMMKII